MDPPPGAPGGAASGRVGKGRGGSRLGLKKASSHAPSLPVLPSVISAAGAAPTVPPPSPTSTTSPRPLPPAPMFAPVVPTRDASSLSPTVTSSSPTLPPRPPQQAPNSRLYPLGGFVNFIQQPHYSQQPQLQGENFHFVDQPMSFNPISQTPPPSAYGTPQPVNSTKETVNIDNDEDDNNGANRPVKKRYWSHEEEERLASAWLNASKDPVKGNDKKGDTFWKEVTLDFNKKGNGKRIREINQLKVHWSRLKSSISDFNGYWTKATQVNTSGYSDDMLEEEAQKMYENRFGKRFSLVHWWKKLKDEPKCCAQFEESEIVDVPDEQSRPIGREAAKAERSGKRKKKNIMEGIVILGDMIPTSCSN